MHAVNGIKTEHRISGKWCLTAIDALEHSVYGTASMPIKIHLLWPSDAIYSILLSIGPGDNLAPGRRQVITWTNADSLKIESLETNLRGF